MTGVSRVETTRIISRSIFGSVQSSFGHGNCVTRFTETESSISTLISKRTEEFNFTITYHN